MLRRFVGWFECGRRYLSGFSIVLALLRWVDGSGGAVWRAPVLFVVVGRGVAIERVVGLASLLWGKRKRGG